MDALLFDTSCCIWIVDRYRIGSFLRLLPWHSCAVAHQHSKLYATRVSFLLFVVWHRLKISDCIVSALDVKPVLIAFAYGGLDFDRFVVEDDSDDAIVVAEWERARGW